MPHTTEYFSELRQTIKTLLGEKGCPWDKRQTNTSLQKHLISELAELNTAIDRNDILLISEINDRQGVFSLDQVLQTVTAKLIRRHPHVFEEFTVKSDEELRAQWLTIKAREKSEKLI
jgi:tetrapyrrole methylase family protein / MazG family protein